MTRWRGSSLAFALAAMIGAAPAAAGESELSLMVGMKSLDEDRFDDAGVSGGILYGLRTSHDFGWPVLLAVDFLFSTDDATKDYPGAFPLAVTTDVETRELDLGVRRYFMENKSIRPFLGGGFSMAQLTVRQVENGSFGSGTEYSNKVVDDTEADLGYWASGGGAYFRGKLVLGVDVRWSDASSEIVPANEVDGLDLGSGGLQYGAFLGYHW